MIWGSVLAALEQIGDPAFRRVLLRGLGLTLALLVASYAGVLMVVDWLVPETSTLPLVGEVSWLDDLASWSSVLVMMVLSVFLMVPVASAITSMFLEEVAQAVEDRHYPGLPAARKTSLSEGLRDTFSFLGVLILANLLALVLYVIFVPFALFIFWGLNGLLLGREYFTLAAARRVGRLEARQMRKRYRLRIWGAGVLMAMPLSIPLLNLVIPILGAATFTHLFHRLNAHSSR